MTESAKSVTILGGGLAGLSAAQKFAEKGWSVTVLEAEADPTIVVDEQDRTWLTIESDDGSVLLRSDSEMDEFVEIIRPEGSWGPFDQPSTVKTRGGTTAMIGVVQESSVWVHLPE